MIARRADGQRKIVVGVACRAMLPGHPVIDFTAQRQGPMDVPVIALMRLVAGRMEARPACARQPFYLPTIALIGDRAGSQTGWIAGCAPQDQSE